MSYFNYQSKWIYYTETGSGKPVLFLHGNTASSRMFELLLPLYEDKFHVILIDFLGHGKSERVEEFPADLWAGRGQTDDRIDGASEPGKSKSRGNQRRCMGCCQCCPGTP